jgi:hypothetical protein
MMSDPWYSASDKALIRAQNYYDNMTPEDEEVDEIIDQNLDNEDEE